MWQFQLVVCHRNRLELEVQRCTCNHTVAWHCKLRLEGIFSGPLSWTSSKLFVMIAPSKPEYPAATQPSE